MPTALITGARGFCATHLATRLKREPGMRVSGWVRSAGSSTLPLFDHLQGVDLRDRVGVARAIAAREPDWVFHLAGVIAGPASDLYAANTLGTVHLLEALYEHAPRARILVVGSAAEYGPGASLPVTEESVCDPRGAYGISKYSATLAAIDCVRRYGMHVVVARPFNVVGAGMPSSVVLGAVLTRAMRALAQDREPVVRVGNAHTERDFLAVEDLVDGCVDLLQRASPGEIFNLCSGEPRCVADLIRDLLAFAPSAVRVESDPTLRRLEDLPSFYGSFDKARLAVGFSPRVSIGESLRRAWVHAASDACPTGGRCDVAGPT